MNPHPLLLSAFLTASGPLLAGQPAVAQHQGHHAPNLAQADAASESAGTSGSADAAAWADAEVRRVDRSARKVTLRHGPIASLAMPPMTMVFQVPDDDVLAALREGARIRFTAELRQGAYVITRVRPAPP